VGRSAAPPTAARTPLRFDGLTRALRAGLGSLEPGLALPVRARVACLSRILDDSRFGERLEAAAGARDPLRALSDLARDYARVPFRTTGNDDAATDLMIDRAAEIEDLCVLTYAAISGRPLVQPGAIVVAEQLRVFLAVAAIAAGASAFVVESDLAPDAIAAEIVRSAGRPLLAGVKGVFAWVHPDDLLVVDGEAGSLRVNPEATAVARFRSRRTASPRGRL
jgi:phosphoenolpyruvate-protein kinase (PTS system EI component)